MIISPEEKKRYPLAGDDPAILASIHELEQIQNVNANERFLLLFLRTQLEDDWRKSCLQLLGTWREYKNSPPRKRWEKLVAAHKHWWNPIAKG